LTCIGAADSTIYTFHRSIDSDKSEQANLNQFQQEKHQEHEINGESYSNNHEQDGIEHIKRKIVKIRVEYLALKTSENRVALNTT